MIKFSGLQAGYFNNEDGATAVEFAIIAAIFLSMILGVFETGRLLYHWNSFQYSVDSATRYALVERNNGNVVTPIGLESYVISQMENLGATTDDVELDPPLIVPGTNGVDFIEITGTYNFQAMVPFLPASWSSITVPASSHQPIPNNI